MFLGKVLLTRLSPALALVISMAAAASVAEAQTEEASTGTVSASGTSSAAESTESTAAQATETPAAPEAAPSEAAGTETAASGTKSAAQAEPEEITITGSYIRSASQFDQPAPIAVFSLADIQASGAKRVSDFTRVLAINTGAEDNPDAFTQNASAGTSNVNLRGLGVGSTLVLLNGRRMTTVGVQTNQGISFVDTAALIPMIALDRVEVLKDGASAIYGSDAVAGVANFLTRSRFSGAEVSADYQVITHGGKNQYNLQGITGLQGERGGVVLAVSYLDQQPLSTAERRLSAFGRDDVSSIGTPGTFFFFGLPGTMGATPIIDPGCREGGIPNVARANVLGPGLDAGTCGFDFGRYYNIVAKETRLNAYAEGNYKLTEALNWRGEITFASNNAERTNSPSFPILTFPTVPASHPNNPFPDQLDPFPRAYFGRILGYDGAPAVQPSQSNTYRVATGLNGKVGQTSYDVAYAYSRNDHTYSTLDHLAQRVQLALNGLGGPGCNPLTGMAGMGNCRYLNPFASKTGDAPNDPALLEWLTSRQENADRAELHVVEGVITRNVFELENVTMDAAAGVQYRRASERVDWNDQSNDQDFVFLLGNKDYSGIVDTFGGFLETRFKIYDRVQVQAAGRYEHYFGRIGGSFDPKLGALVRATDWLAVRGSVSTSFKAPTVFQSYGGATVLQDVRDPVLMATAFVGNTAVGNPNLKPEQSVNYNLGLTARPFTELTLDLDFWNFEFTDVIIPENAQAKLNANPMDPNSIIRAGDPMRGPVTRIITNFVNASEVKTRGLDLTAQLRFNTPAGLLFPTVTGTYVLQYDLKDPNIPDIVKGAGDRNYTNFGTSVPRLRFNAGLSWVMGMHSANAFVRYIASYKDDQNKDENMVEASIRAHATLDLQYSLSIGNYLFDSNTLDLTVGCFNVFDADPPYVATNGGFDSKVHDPRGRIIYTSMKVGF